jgi:hypothetical protein
MLLLLFGDQPVFNSMIVNALDEDCRPTFFYWIAFGRPCVRFIAPSVAPVLMRISLFAPFWLGISMLVFQANLIFLSVDSKTKKHLTKGYSIAPL